MGVDHNHTSASPDDTNQFGANGSCSARGFDWETGRRMYDAFSVRGTKLEQRRNLHRVHLWWKGQSILSRTWWTLCFSFPTWVSRTLA